MRNCVLVVERDPSVSRFMQLKLEEEELELKLWGESSLELTEELNQIEKDLLQIEQPLKESLELWTEGCLSWWDVYQEEFL